MTACLWRRALVPAAALALLACVGWSAMAAGRRQPRPPLPPGATRVDFENLEGIILVQARLKGSSGLDTTGALLLDTGAGFLAVGSDLAPRLGLGDDRGGDTAIAFTARPLSRFELGTMQIDQVTPVLSVDVGVIRRVCGRQVLGLLGQRLFTGRALWIDYERGQLVVLPAAPGPGPGDRLPGSEGPWPRRAESGSARAIVEASRGVFAGLLSARAVPLPVRLEGDGKLLVRARFSNPSAPRFSSWLTLVLDTGATKCVLFDPAFGDSVPGASSWRSVSGLVAPTLTGSETARLTLAPEMQLGGSRDPGTFEKPAVASRKLVDCAVVESELAEVLSLAVGEPVQGLVGYSFLKHFRLGIDYAHRLLWLDPCERDWDARPYEYSHVGLQLERDGDALRVAAVASGSPAAGVGIAAGDELLSVGGRSVSGAEVLAVLRELEGPAGTRVRLVTRQNGVVRVHALVRRKLL